MSAAVLQVDLSDYKIHEVQATKISNTTLKNIENLDFKRIINNLKQSEETEQKSVKVVNAKAIIAKYSKKREKIFEKLKEFEFFVDLDIAQHINVVILEKLVDFIDNLLNNTFLFKNDLYIYEQEKEDFKKYDKEMLLAKIEFYSDINNFYKTEMRETREGVQVVKKYAIDAKKLFNYLKINAYNVKVINISINPFANKTYFYINKEEKEAVLVKNKIALKEPNYDILKQITEEEKQEILNDYKSLWDNGEKLHDVLDFIIYGRFLSARKELQLNINAPSSWGKGFFMGALEDIGAGFTIKQSDFKGDRPSGLNIDALQNSLCLLIDEFKKYNNYLFEINNYMFIEEKFGSRYKVAVYARLFFNAQKSESLTGYINEQITNRISLLEIKTDRLLINSAVYKRNKLKYKEVIKELFYNYFKEKIEYLVNLGQVKAEEVADKQVQQIINKYKIKAKSTSELIVDTLIEFLEDYKRYKEYLANDEKETAYKLLTYKEKELAEKYIFYNDKNENYYIVKFEQTIMTILKERLEERDYKKIEYSRGELKDILNKFLKAEYKNVHIPDLKAKKKALVIKETNIFKYKNNLTDNAQQTNTQQNNVAYNAMDLLNANIAYSANVLTDELRTEKNRFLLLTTLNSILTIPSSLKQLLDIYNTEDINLAINNYIRDKAELLKQLQLYKEQSYIIKKQNENATIPF